MDSFGKNFVLTDWDGAYHPELNGAITGCPAGVFIDMDFIQQQLDRRSPSNHPYSTQRKEKDRVIFLSGIEANYTTGHTIIFKIPNEDVQINSETLNVLKPSHASFVYKIKYRITDNLGISRASARQTACRVVAGAIAQLILRQYGITVEAKAGEVAECKDDEDTFGATVYGEIKNLPIGLGEPVYDKFDARLAYAMLSINACKGFEIGQGFKAATMTGSDYNDRQTKEFAFCSNNDGGVQAGITNGQTVYFSLAFKPIPTIIKEQQSIDFEGNEVCFKGTDRNDKCVIPRVLPVVEAMAALVVVDFMLNKSSQQ